MQRAPLRGPLTIWRNHERKSTVHPEQDRNFRKEQAPYRTTKSTAHPAAEATARRDHRATQPGHAAWRRRKPSGGG